MKSPHLLLAASNVRKMRANLDHVLDASACAAIEQEIVRNVIALFALGEQHRNFADGLHSQDWRQIVSRLYYAAYNVVRALRFANDGQYSTDSTDHKKVSDLPPGFINIAKYQVQLPILREDRNLCDYDHSATETDLTIAVVDAKLLVSELFDDARQYLKTHKGIIL